MGPEVHTEFVDGFSFDLGKSLWIILFSVPWIHVKIMKQQTVWKDSTFEKETKQKKKKASTAGSSKAATEVFH